MPLPLCYLNGEFLPLEQARVSPLDRAFLFGDAVYEVIPAYAGRTFRLREHLARMRGSLAAIRMQPPRTDVQWNAICRRLLDAGAASAEDAYVYLQVTRGAESGRNHAWPEDLKPTVFAFASALTGARALDPAGVSAMTAQDTRWARCDIKSTSLLANVLLRREAADAGHFEVVLLDDGYLTEASSSAVHVLAGNTLYATPNGPAILPGITRVVVEELAARMGLEVRAAPVTERELRSADELWISLSTRGVLAVTALDGLAVGNAAPAGAPGPLFKRMRAEFVRHIAELAGTPEL